MTAPGFERVYHAALDTEADVPRAAVHHYEALGWELVTTNSETATVSDESKADRHEAYL
jgi:hypothetical protein